MELSPIISFFKTFLLLEKTVPSAFPPNALPTHPHPDLLPPLPFTSVALNIIVNNDDGFGSANIRELYRLLDAAGHNAWIVAPVSNQSGKGGTEVFTTDANLTSPSEFDLIPEGTPSFGIAPNDSHIWYYNGTPTTCTFFALDYVVPNY